MLLITVYLGAMLVVLGGISLFIGCKVYYLNEVNFLEWEIFSINSSTVVITFLFDWIRLRFIGLVIIISSMVLFYSTYYIIGDKFFTRFIITVYLFVLSIVFLILSPNLIRILLGWDGLGLVSYCLVIYYQNNKSSRAGIITILSNRVGDVAILLGIAWLLNFGRWNFFYLQHIYTSWELVLLMVLVLIAAMTKRAQIPFSAWLPAAMAAPTPVSALVHSSTLVTAGVYLLIRFNYILGVNKFLFYVGVFTIFMSGLGANYETDLKKIIALSTLSQLGLMIITLGLGFYEFTFFHLMTHAIYKSLLFLCAGVFIHSIGDIQDIRILGGLITSCPSTSYYFICSSMALCGFPFLSGFFSKDIILELFFTSEMNLFIFIAVTLATVFTVTYSVRLMYFLFFKNYGVKGVINMSDEVGIVAPISVLVVITVLRGGFMRVEFFPTNLIYLPIFVKLIILILMFIIFGSLFYILNLKIIPVTLLSNFFKNYAGSIWFLPALTRIFFMPVLHLGRLVIKYLDHGWIEYIGGQGLIFVIKSRASYLDYYNWVGVKSYLFLIFVAVVFVAVIN